MTEPEKCSTGSREAELHSRGGGSDRRTRKVLEITITPMTIHEQLDERR